MGQPVNLLFPVKGLSRNHPYALAPEGTTPAALNVRPEDAIDHRFRGGRRGGLTKHVTTRVSDAPIQHLTAGVVVPVTPWITRLNQIEALGSHVTSMALGTDGGDTVGELQFAPDTAGLWGNPRCCCYDTDGYLYGFIDNSVYKYSRSRVVQGSIQITADEEWNVFDIVYCPAWGYIAAFVVGNTDWAGAGGVQAGLFLIDPTDMSIVAYHDLGNGGSLGWNAMVSGKPLVWDTANEQLIVVCYDVTTTYGGSGGHPARNIFAFNNILVIQWSTVIGEAGHYLKGGAISGDTLYFVYFNPDTDRPMIYQLNTTTGAGIRSDNLPAIDGNDPYVFAGGGETATNCVVQDNGTIVIGYNSESSAAPLIYWGAVVCVEWNTVTEEWDVVWYYYHDEVLDAATSVLPYGTLYRDKAGNIYFSATQVDFTDHWVNAADGIDTAITVIQFDINGNYQWYWDGDGPFDTWAEDGGSGFAIYEFPDDYRPTSWVDYAYVQDGIVYDSENNAYTHGTNTLSSRVNDIQSAWAYQNVYFVDGINSKVLILLSTLEAPWGDYYSQLVDWSALVASDGEGTLPTKCGLVCTYRGRVVVAARASDPHNWFMSAVNDPLDWDYAPATTVATQAVAGNNSDAGKVGDAITALIPYNDDLLIFGGLHSIHQLSGDPMGNGAIDLLTDQTGIRFGDAHCRDPRGALYFLGTDGVYMLAPAENGGTQLTSITGGRLDNEFDSIDWGAYRAHMVWDYHRAGLLLTLIPYDSTSAVIVYFWSQQADSWWVDSYPLTMGPTCMLPMAGDAAADRHLLFGCRDGYIRYYDDDAETDDGTAVTSYVDWQLPATALDMQQAITRIQAILGESSADVTLQIFRGSTAQEVAAATTPALARTLVAGRAMPITQGVGGRHLRIRITSTGNRWAMEQLQLVMNVLGKGRKR